MRTYLDSLCPRCGVRSSTLDLGLDLARFLATIHICADGVRTPAGEPTVRVVYGPGERLADDEDPRR